MPPHDTTPLPLLAFIAVLIWSMWAAIVWVGVRHRRQEERAQESDA